MHTVVVNCIFRTIDHLDSNFYHAAMVKVSLFSLGGVECKLLVKKTKMYTSGPGIFGVFEIANDELMEPKILAMIFRDHQLYDE